MKAGDLVAQRLQGHSPLMQADADDRKCADAFREYVVPVQMYSMLRDRSRKQVGFLSLTRCSALSRNAASAHMIVPT